MRNKIQFQQIHNALILVIFVSYVQNNIYKDVISAQFYCQNELRYRILLNNISLHYQQIKTTFTI
jgi:hypothetical protein